MKIEQFQKNGCAGKEDIMKKQKKGLSVFAGLLLLALGIVAGIVAGILIGLNDKSATNGYDYGSFCGGIIGGIISGLLTMAGVCWTISDLQSERNEQLHKRVIECATIIYYDFKFAHDELPKICAQEKDKKFYNFYIDKDWITHVATLVYVDELSTKIILQTQDKQIEIDKLELIKFKSAEHGDRIGIIEKIYTIYGLMEFLSRRWDNWNNGGKIPDDVENHCGKISNEFKEKKVYIGDADIENLLTYNNMESYDIIMKVLQNIMNSDKQPSSD